LLPSLGNLKKTRLPFELPRLRGRVGKTTEKQKDPWFAPKHGRTYKTLKQFTLWGAAVTQRKSSGKEMKYKKILGLLPSLGNLKKN
jgi:hypothetical protein